VETSVEDVPQDLRRNFRLQDSLPTIPVPLEAPDPDVPLDLSSALRDIYDEAGYDLSIDYRKPPPKPLLPEGDRCWLEESGAI
jgi:hypothetical protein